MITDVGIDMDGVLFDFASVFREYCERRMERPLPPPTHWHFYEDWGLSEEKFYEWLDEATLVEDLFLKGAPIRGSIDGWNRLKDAGLRIHVLTHRAPNARIQTIQWLHQYGMVPDSMYFGYDKVVLETMAREEAAAIDDYTGYYDQYVSVGVKAFLRTQPWNVGHLARRVLGLPSFADAVITYNNNEMALTEWLGNV